MLFGVGYGDGAHATRNGTCAFRHPTECEMEPNASCCSVKREHLYVHVYVKGLAYSALGPFLPTGCRHALDSRYVRSTTRHIRDYARPLATYSSSASRTMAHILP